MDKNENTFYVYIHYRKSDGLPFYAGKGKKDRDGRVSGRSDWWNRIVSKHGFFYKRLVSNVSESVAFDIEKSTISLLRNAGFDICNLTDGGEGMSGHKPSAETLAKRAKALRGKKRTPEQRKRISEAGKGRKLSQSVIEGMIKRRTGSKRSLTSIKKAADSNRGKVRSDEQRLKMSGLNHSCADLTIYKFENKTTGEIFIGTRFDFATYIGVKSSNISGIFKKIKPAKSAFNWILIKENNDTKTEEKTEEH